MWSMCQSSCISSQTLFLFLCCIHTYYIHTYIHHVCSTTCIYAPIYTHTHVPLLEYLFFHCPSMPHPMPIPCPYPCPCSSQYPCPHIHPWHICISTKPHPTHLPPTPSTRPLARPLRPPPIQSCHSLPVQPFLSTCDAPLLSAQSWAALGAYTKASSSTRIVAPANRTSSTCRDPSARGVLFPAPALAPPDRGPCLRSADACPLPAHLALPLLAPLWSHARPPGVYSTK